MEVASYNGKEKMRNIPESIYLPRKHFPTNRNVNRDSREREIIQRTVNSTHTQKNN